jgi:mono/diheme cytochrome c family protein
VPRILRIIVILGGAVLVFVVLGVLVLWFSGGRQLDRVYTLAAEPLVIPTDSASLAEGERLSALLGCNDCHGANLAGQVFIDALPFAYLPAPNLTSGDGGVGAVYSAAAFEHAIRHGVDKNGRALMIMPSYEYHHFADEDVASLIAYLQSVPPVTNGFPPRQVGFIGRLATGVAAAGLFPAAALDHEAKHPATIERGVTLEYGEYHVKPCAGCHGPDLAGGVVPGAGPDVPLAANLTPDDATGLGDWTEADFVRAMREGVRPDGTTLDGTMPWRAYQLFTDEELAAMWLYLRSLDGVESR